MEIVVLTAENIETHLDRCREIQTYLVSDKMSVSDERFRQTATDEASYFIGIFEAGVLLGLGVVSRLTHPVNITGYVNNIVVHPDGRGKGLFAVIMDELERYAEEVWGCTDMALTCSREPVQAMYEKRNYSAKATNFYTKKL